MRGRVTAALVIVPHGLRRQHHVARKGVGE